MLEVFRWDSEVVSSYKGRFPVFVRIETEDASTQERSWKTRVLGVFGGSFAETLNNQATTFFSVVGFFLLCFSIFLCAPTDQAVTSSGEKQNESYIQKFGNKYIFYVF